MTSRTVAAEDEVERADVDERLQQVEPPKRNHSAKFVLCLPTIRLLDEVLGEQLGLHAPLNLRRTVDAASTGATGAEVGFTHAVSSGEAM